jgi:DHA2 family multidrug resistance protein
MSDLRRHHAAAALVFAGCCFALSAKGTVLLSDQVIQAWQLDRYSIQWVIGPAAVVGPIALFAPLYYVNVVGTRPLIAAGGACLAFGSAGTALARDSAEAATAVALRAAGGLFGIPCLVVLMALYPRHRGLAYGGFLTAIYGGQVLAEPIGGLIAFHPSWRALFWFLTAGGAWIALSAYALIPEAPPTARPPGPFDWPGLLLFAAFSGLVLFLLFRGNYLSWAVSTPICLALAAVPLFAGLFVWRERTAAVPFINLGMFASRTVWVAMLSAGFWCAALYGLMLQLPHYLLARGYEHWKAGWVLMPAGLVLVATMLACVPYRNRAVYVWVLRGGLAGMAAFALAIARSDDYTSWQALMALTTAFAACAGVCLPFYARLAYEGQDPEHAATTGAMKFYLRSFGATVGTLGAGVLLERATAWGFDFVGTSLPPGHGPLLSLEPHLHDHFVRRGSTPAEAAGRTDALVGHWVAVHARVIGYRAAFQLCAAFAAAGLVCACFVHRRKEFSILDGDA